MLLEGLDGFSFMALFRQGKGVTRGAKVRSKAYAYETMAYNCEIATASEARVNRFFERIRVVASQGWQRRRAPVFDFEEAAGH